MIIAIDFDGTIVTHDYPKIGKLKPNAAKVINYLGDLGIKIIIWTVRTTEQDIKAATDFLKENGIKFDAVNQNYFVSFPNFPKIYADVYIDDRQLGGIPDDWKQIYTYLLPALTKDPQINDNNLLKHPKDLITG